MVWVPGAPVRYRNVTLEMGDTSLHTVKDFIKPRDFFSSQ
jgi:hypothetical protein